MKHAIRKRKLPARHARLGSKVVFVIAIPIIFVSAGYGYISNQPSLSAIEKYETSLQIADGQQQEVVATNALTTGPRLPKLPEFSTVLAELNQPIAMQPAPVESAVVQHHNQQSHHSTEARPAPPEAVTVHDSNDLLSLDTPVAGLPSWRNLVVKKGDTLVAIFKRAGLQAAEAIAIANLDNTGSLNRLYPGQSIALQVDAQENLLLLQYRINQIKTLRIERTSSGFVAKVQVAETKRERRQRIAVITSSLYMAAKAINLDDNLIEQLINIYKWRVDFAREIRPGDTFKLVYEALLNRDGVEVSHDKILAAELTINGKKLQAIRYVNRDGNADYYNPQGDSLKSPFLRNPLPIVRITSKFSKKRYHPIFKKWRAHKGVDYGAKRGTRVFATGDGVVSLRKRKSGYGKTIVIKHRNGYSTLYAHLSRYHKKLKVNSRVRQGQIIGYVGSTGNATGPHLHYEFRIHDQHHDPLKVQLPNSEQIPRKQLKDFRGEAQNLVLELNSIKPAIAKN